MPKEKTLITGGSGFVGTNLVAFFIEKGWEVGNFDVASPRNPEHLPYWKKVDILQRKQLIREVQDFEPSILLHFAARTDLGEQVNLDGYAANIEGTCNILEALSSTPSIQRVIFASSQLVCRLGYIPTDEHDYCPTTLYGRSKVLMERIIWAAGELGATWTIVRPTSLWGPWFDVPYKNFFTAIARNMYIHPAGVKTLKQWGFVGNSVYQVARLLEAPAEQVHKKTFYLADYEPVDLYEFAVMVQQAMGARPIKVVSPVFLKGIAFIGDFFQKLGWRNPPLTSFRYGNIVTSEIQNTEPLRNVIGKLPYTTDEGIKITVEWLEVRQQNTHE